MNGDEHHADHVGQERTIGMCLDVLVKEQDNPENDHLVRVPTSSPTSINPTVLADPFARLAAACTTSASGGASGGGGSSTSGRGSQAGWTCCPICFPFSKKVFAR